MEPLSLIQVLKLLGNLWKNIKLKTKVINTYIMDKLENASRQKYSLFLLSIIDFRSLLLHKNMLLMMLIKIYYIDNHYQIEKKWVVHD